MVEQHYYTRAKSGVFRNTEGFDTVAKSSGLRTDFIKKSLYPFCKYDSPLELQKMSEKDEEKFPKSLLFTYSQSGDLIIGQTKYLDKDLGSYTRNAYFVHQYIIPSTNKEDIETVIKNVNNMLYIKDFKETMPQNQTKEIESLGLSDICFDAFLDILNDKETVLSSLGIDEDIFKKLIYAVIMSISGKKKVYIALDVEASMISIKAKEVLGFILSSIPYELRRKIGFLTYARQPEGKKGINIMFVEKGSINSSDNTIARDYIFDFANKTFKNVNDAKGYYLDFVWENVQSKSKMEKFFEYTEEIGKCLSEDEKISLEHLNKESMLFEFSKYDAKVYEDNKGYMLDSVMGYIKKVKDKDINGELNTVIYEMLNKEYEDAYGKIKGYMPETSIIDSFVKYFSIVDSEDIKKRINLFLLRAISNGRDYDPEYASSVFKACETNEDLFKRIIETIFKNSDLVSGIFYKYLDERFSQAKNLRTIITEIKFWIKTYEDILGDDYFIKKSTENILEFMRNSKNKIEANKTLISGLKADRNFGINNSTRLNLYINDIKESCEGILLNSIDLNEISKEEILTIEFSLEHNSRIYNTIKAAKEVLLSSEINEKMIKRKVDELGADQLDLKFLLRRCLKNEVREQNFYKIIYAFEQYDTRGFEDSVSYEFDDIIYYVKSAGNQEVHNFLEWTFENKVFLIGGNDKPKRKFAEAIKSYFLDEDRETIRDKELRKRFKKYSALDEIMDELEYETSSGIHKVYVKHKKHIAIFAAALILIAAICAVAVISYKMLFSSDDKVNKPKVSPKPAATAVPSGKSKTKKSGYVNVEDIGQKLTDELSTKIGQGYSISGKVQIKYLNKKTDDIIIKKKKSKNQTNTSSSGNSNVNNSNDQNKIILSGDLLNKFVQDNQLSDKKVTITAEVEVKSGNTVVKNKNDFMKKVLNEFFFGIKNNNTTK